MQKKNPKYNYKKQERRKYKRTSKPFTVKFQIMPPGTRKGKSKEWDTVAVLNLGAGGVLFYYNKNLKANSLIGLKISFAGGRPPIEITGKVLRIMNEPRFPGLFFIATLFVELDKEKKKEIHKIVKEFYPENLNY